MMLSAIEHEVENLKASVSPTLAVWLTFAVLLAAFSVIFRPFFPLPDGQMGHDYVLVMTQWLDGHIWFRNNGLTAPWFTPSFCAGQPFFADPQSAFYSVPQLFSILIGPVNAAYWTLILCSALLFWGGYLLMRKVFATGPIVAVLVGGLLMFNGFLPYRLVVGHMAFHAFATVPWVALLLLVPTRTRVNSVAVAVGAGILIAYWVHSGLGTLILASGLSILLVTLVSALCGSSLHRFFIRGTIASIVGIGLSASKLWAAYALLSNFPRTFYKLPGASSLFDGILVTLGGLFLPSQLAAEFGMPRLTNVQWGLAPHEWAYNFGIVTAVLVCVLATIRLMANGPKFAVTRRQVVIGVFLLLGLAWPLAFNVWDPDWNAFLKTVPVINSASTPIRWLIVYIPVIAIAIGIWLAGAQWGNWAILIAGGCLILTVAQAAFEPREFYLRQNYDVRPVAIADQMLRSGNLNLEIKVIGMSAPMKAGKFETTLYGNDTFIAGMSQVFCYNPIFGYKLEKYSIENLKPGSVFTERDGQLNMKNPACYVFPNENACHPGDLFQSSQLSDLGNFVQYRPFAFRQSERQKAANLITGFSIILIALMIVGYGLIMVSRRLRKNKSTPV